MTKTVLYWLHTLSPTHVGTGRGVGYIDLPIQRDKITNWPIIPGSSFKGVWADHFGATEKKRQTDHKLRLAFGLAADEGENNSNAGALVPTDARLACLPIRSFRGTFAWCTSPLALQMLERDLTLAGMTNLPSVPEIKEEDVVYHAKETVLKEEQQIYLEDLDFKAQLSNEATAWAERIAGWVFPQNEKFPHNENWRSLFVKRFVIVPNPVFDFFTQTGTEVTTRVKIDDDLKTVIPGALWNEEALPAETIMVGLVSCDRVYARDAHGITSDELIKSFASEELILQIGGKASVGRGRVRCVFTSNKEV